MQQKHRCEFPKCFRFAKLYDNVDDGMWLCKGHYLELGAKAEQHSDAYEKQDDINTLEGRPE